MLRCISLVAVLILPLGSILLAQEAHKNKDLEKWFQGIVAGGTGTNLNVFKLSWSPLDIHRRKLQEVEQLNLQTTSKIFVFSAFRNSSFGRKQRGAFLGYSDGDGSHSIAWNLVSNSTEQQREFLRTNACVEGASQRFEVLITGNHVYLAEELWKYCSLYAHGGLFVDEESPILSLAALEHLILGTRKSNNRNGGIATLMDSFAPNSMYGALLFFNQPKDKIAFEMAKLLVTTDVSTLISSPLMFPRALYDLIQVSTTTQEENPKSMLSPGKNSQWYILRQACSENPFQKSGRTKARSMVENHEAYSCAASSGLCCFIYNESEESDDWNSREAIMGSNKPIQPRQSIFYRGLPKPYATATTQPQIAQFEELPYLSTVKSQANFNGNNMATVPTFYEVLKQKDCLPSHTCNKCLSDKKHGATCVTCLEDCPCFCKELCKPEHDEVTTQNFNELIVSKPRHSRDPTRLIPRIVHQTFFEDLDPQKYPNMSRLSESFKRSGWEYHFYTDDQAGDFLSQHFPPQVRQAYDILIPGAFKADLFRYCVLLVRGGVYADVDIMMGPSLDAAIPADVGFMVGVDEPGKKFEKRMCLWNGFIASAPGHPFLAKIIETVVNNIHRRFTSVDVATMHCPSPEMSIINSFSPLFVAGPCIMGSTINRFLGRHGQTQFDSGVLSHTESNIPGRTVILHQNKNDMGAHRFTFQEQNLIVFSTDFPESDDREKLEDYEHYSNTRIKFTTYGLDGVYKDAVQASTDLIRIRVE